VDWQHGIDRWQQGPNAGRAWLEALKTQQRIEPDHATRMTTQSRSL